MLVASTIGQIAHPFFVAFAWVLAFYYSLVPNYAVAIALLTITVMVVVFPITRRGTRSMMRMQLLAPEMKKLQARYKAQPGATTQEKAASRQQLNEEMMALYKEHGVSPTGGCLPMFLQFPIFLILYGTINGLVHKAANGLPQPLYISSNTRLYRDVIAGHGKLTAFGFNLADSAISHGLSMGARIAFIGLIVVAIVLQYIQMRQMSGRNPAARQANPQMQQMQKIFPIICAIIYIRISAGVNVYFVVSSIFRIVQQEYMYRHDPHITDALEKLRTRQKTDEKVLEAKARIEGERPKGFRARLAAAAGIEPSELPARASSETKGPRQTPASGGKGAVGKRVSGAGKPAPQKKPPATASTAPRRPQPRAQGKRPRRPR